MSACASVAQSLPASASEGFVVYDALLHKGKPTSASLGMTWLPPVARIWRPGKDVSLVDVEGLRAALKLLPAAQREMFLDIEVWHLLRVPRAVRDATIAKLQQVVDVVKAERPSISFGFYAFPPVSVYWPLVIDGHEEHREWAEANDSLAGIASQVNMLFPSLYTFYDDLAGWKKAADRLLTAARRYGKPVYPFLWNEFHDSNEKLRDKELPPSMWRAQLEFCRERADGVVLWGGWQRYWSDGAGWWKIAREVLELRSGQMSGV
jgi:hypothetical protein